MSNPEEPANIGRVLSFLREWDRGDRTVRGRMLSTFVGQSSGKTCYELESEFAQVSSLFLARLTTWMRLTYPQSDVTVMSDTWSLSLTYISTRESQIYR